MASMIVVEELHVAVLMPRTLTASESRAVLRVVRGKRFIESIATAVHRICDALPSLRQVQVTVTK